MPPPRGTSCSSARARRRTAVPARGRGTSRCSSRRGCSAPAGRRPSGPTAIDPPVRAGRPVLSASWWIGICPTARGKVIGTRPPGFTAPATTRAIASGPRVPRCQVRSTAGARSIQSSTTKGPAGREQHDERHAGVGDRVDEALLIAGQADVGPRARLARDRAGLADGDDHQVVLAGERAASRMSRVRRLQEVRARGHRPRRVRQRSAQRVVERARLGAEVLHPGAEMIGAGRVRARSAGRAARPAAIGSSPVVVLQQHDRSARPPPGRSAASLASARIARSRHPCRGSRTDPAPVLSRRTRITASSMRAASTAAGLDQRHAVACEFGSAHHDVQPRRQRLSHRVGLVARDAVGDELGDAVGITDDDAAEAVLAGEHIGQQAPVRVHRRAVQGVERGHDGCRSRGDAGAEGLEIRLAQPAPRDVGRVVVAPRFGRAVGDEVLEARGDGIGAR